MISIQELTRWISTLDPQNSIATDDGGNSLVELNTEGKETGAYYEVGGIPEEICECGRYASDCTYDESDPDSEHHDNG